jgi:tellurite methyltransferase
MNKNYWKEFYKTKPKFKESSFARFIADHLKGDIVDLGCGNGRDTYFFIKKGKKCVGVDQVNGIGVDPMTIKEYIAKYPSPQNVYARFLWHAIDDETQLEILDWTKGFIFIEARTTDDKKRTKTFGKHKRNYVNVAQLVADLKNKGFDIGFMQECTGLARFKDEDPHVVRIIAAKV